MASRRLRRLLDEQQHSADDYSDVLVQFDSNWRVIRHQSGASFILQHRSVSAYYVGKWRTAETASTAFDMMSVCTEVTDNLEKIKEIAKACVPNT